MVVEDGGMRNQIVKWMAWVFLVYGSTGWELGGGEDFFQAGDKYAEDSMRPWTDRPILDDGEEFHFIVVTDRTGGQRDGIFESAVEKINLMRPDFVVSVGDLVQGYFNDVEQSDLEWEEFHKMEQSLDMRFFRVPGNHDIWNDFSRAVWEKRFGRSYYHFLYRDVLFLAINSEDGKATTVSAEQAEYFVQVLQRHQDVRWTILLMHKPLWFNEESTHNTGWTPILDALQGRNHTIFAGHRHHYIAYQRDGMDYIDLATTGGGSALSGPVHGRFDHIVWVTMTDKGPKMANLTLDGIMDKNVRTEESSRELDAISRGFSIDLAPISLNPNGEPVSELTMVNQSDRSIRVNGYFGNSRVFYPVPNGLDTEIRSGETIAWPVRFVLAGIPGPGEFIEFHYSMHAMSQALGTDVVWEGAALAAYERTHPIPRTQESVIVDGDLAEWQGDLSLIHETKSAISLSGAVADWLGPKDMSFRFGVCTDGTRLILAVDVTDDHWIDREQMTNPAQDIGHLLISKSGVEDSDSIYLYLNPSSVPQRAITSYRSGTGPTPEFASRPSDHGYTMEIALPLSVLGSLDAVRLNVGMTDVDHPAGSRSNLFWRPAWNSSRSWDGSGTFEFTE